MLNSTCSSQYSTCAIHKQRKIRRRDPENYSPCIGVSMMGAGEVDMPEIPPRFDFQMLAVVSSSIHLMYWLWNPTILEE